jgi:FkbM family methyltransferase
LGTVAAFYRRAVQYLLDRRLLPRARFLKRINRLVVSSMTPERVETEGHIIYLDPVDSLHLAESRAYEPLETALVREHVKPGDAVLDIGANIGYFTLLMARLVGEEGSVIAVEPDADNCRLLAKNIEANGYRNVRVVQKAVAGSSGHVTLFRSLRSGAQHSIGGDGEPVEVPAIALDDLAAAHGRPVGFMKIDIEGAEMIALRGGSALLSQPGLKIMIEFNPTALARLGEDPADLPRLLLDHGFTLHDLDRRAGGLHPVSLDEIVERYNTANGRYTNLYCVKEERAAPGGA